MSQFLPEGFSPSTTSTVVASDEVTDADLSLIKRVLAKPEIIAQTAPNFFAYLVDYIAVNQPNIPISQVIGYRVSAIPAGTFFAYGAATAPTGYLICDGSAISRTTYADLFTAIGTNYGTGDGSTTFNVPDFLGRMLVGKGSNAAVNAFTDNDGVTEANRRPQHKHTPHTHTTTVNEYSAGGSTSSELLGITHNTSTGGTRSKATDSVDGGSGTSTDSLDAPAYGVVVWIVKT